MLLVFVMVAAATVDFAYIQQVRSELRIATDAAAKAGSEALARTESESQAINAAINYAAANAVAGQPLSISTNDVLLGRVIKDNSGKWNFQSGLRPFNSVQVNAKVTSSLFFGSVLGRSVYEPQFEAVAGYQEYDVILCLDRSGSMLFDMSGVDYSYPPNNPNLSKFTAWGTIWQNHLSPPHPTSSRWAVLSRAVTDFLDVVNNLSPQPYAGLVTWASDYTMPISPYTQFKSATTDVSLPTKNDFATQMASVKSSMSSLGSVPMMGGTNLSAGLDMAVSRLTSNSARSLSNKVIILLTDGEWNEGRDPILAAQDAQAKGVVIHTISMLTTEQSVLNSISGITGGKSYTTANETELRNAFKEIATGLQVTLVE